MKSLLPTLLATFSLASALYGASYSTDFENFLAVGSNIAGQDNWRINDSTDQFSQIQSSNANPSDPFTVSKALNLGDASAVTSLPVLASVVLSHDYSSTVGATHLIFDFIIADSANGAFTNRDEFGASISNGALNVFSISFVPKTQSGTPDSGDIAQWDLFYTLGSQSTVALNLGVLENSQYKFDLLFNPNGVNPALTDFLLSITSAVPNTMNDGAVGMDLDPSTAIGDLNISWSKHGGAAFGSNSIVVDNLAAIPEPSSSLLLCLAGLGLVSRRKRS